LPSLWYVQISGCDKLPVFSPSIGLLQDDEINAAYEALMSSRKTPEVIWNPGMLHDLQGTLVDLCQQARLDQQRDLISGSTKKASGWFIPKEFMIKYDALECHTEVDGVFIDLLLQNPGYPIRYDHILFVRCIHPILLSYQQISMQKSQKSSRCIVEGLY
jgi:hypothetical protein